MTLSYLLVDSSYRVTNEYLFEFDIVNRDQVTIYRVCCGILKLLVYNRYNLQFHF